MTNETTQPACEENRSSLVQRLYEDHAVRLEAFARGILKNSDQASDVLQTVFAKLSNPEQVRVLPSEYELAWLYRVTKNECLTLLRRQSSEIKAHRARQPSIVTADPEIDDKRSEQIERLQLAIRELPLRDRNLMKRRAVDGQSFGQISEEIGTSVTALTTRFSRIVAKLRRQLRDHHDAD